MEDFLGKHRSRPYNPLIANAFYRAGFIESWGRGIMKIREACKNAGNPEPTYHIKKDELTVVFEAKELFDLQIESFEHPKELFDSRKEAFEKAICDLNGYHSSRENLLKTFDLLYEAEFFGRQEIEKLCDINSTNTGKMIDKLKACNSIEPVKGHGKGKYRFII